LGFAKPLKGLKNAPKFVRMEGKSVISAPARKDQA
jgi:hypothetical protein